ncbi:MAG TPA: hypothetical protein VMJ49_13475 [Gaiellaceae bacterium]|nr:hypothetical protein [Gaiellaceae bacterium]
MDDAENPVEVAVELELKHVIGAILTGIAADVASINRYLGGEDGEEEADS